MKISFKNQDRNSFLTHINYTKNLFILSVSKCIRNICSWYSFIIINMSAAYNYFPFSFAVLFICADLLFPEPTMLEVYLFSRKKI